MKKFFWGIYVFLIASSLLFPVAHGVQIAVGIPGTNLSSTSTPPGTFISNFYQFALFIAGILAFGVVVYGGIRYAASAGNPSAQSDAKEWIWGALIGLLLLAGAYLILNVVNPQLVNLNLPTLNNVTTANLNGTGGAPNGGAPTSTPQAPTSNKCIPNTCKTQYGGTGVCVSNGGSLFTCDTTANLCSTTNTTSCIPQSDVCTSTTSC